MLASPLPTWTSRLSAHTAWQMLHTSHRAAPLRSLHWKVPKASTSKDPAGAPILNDHRELAQPNYHNEIRRFKEYRIRRRRSWTKLLLGASTVAYLYHHYSKNIEIVPHTGRRRYMLFNETAERLFATVATQINLQQYGTRLLPPEDLRVKRVFTVMERILGGLQPKDLLLLNASNCTFQIYVTDEFLPTAAFMAGCGNVFISTRTLDACGSDDELALILSHEIAHQLARHIPERLSSTAFAWPLIFLLTICGFTTAASYTLFLAQSNGKSRQTEAEADEIGLQIMSQACFDPNVAPLFWRKRGIISCHNSGSSPWKQLLSSRQGQGTHPHPHQRAKAATKQLSRALEARDKASCPNLALLKAFRDAFDPYIFKRRRPVSLLH